MRTDEEILKDRGRFLDECVKLNIPYRGDSGYILELLLDIRDLLEKGSRKSVPTSKRKK